MGGAFNPLTKAFDCENQQITAKLNQVFKNPGTGKYIAAQNQNWFDKVLPDAADNWKDLLIAYVYAGVDVGNEFPSWVSYLKALGTGLHGPEYIYAIAQMRYKALTANPPQGIDTKTHQGGGVQASAGVISSPCPLM
jgi:hypothetical protein